LVVSKPRTRRKSHPHEEEPKKLIDFVGLEGGSFCLQVLDL